MYKKYMMLALSSALLAACGGKPDAAGGAAPTADAGAQLNVLCSVQADWCNAAAVAFEKKTGIKVAITQKGSGESLAQVNAEAANPKTDVWYGGTGDPHIAAAERNLTEAYDAPANAELHPWAQEIASITGNKTHGVYMGVLGFGANPEILGKKNAKSPACWADLTKPEYKGEVQIANPNSSGTAYVAIATLVQLMGEDKAFAYLKSLHGNVSQYTKSGTAPIKAVARGETGVSVSFLQDAVTEQQAGFKLETVVPCEGTGYEVGGISIIKGARNMDAAKKFVDWALSPEGQAVGATVKQFHTPSNIKAAVPAGAPDPTKVKLIKYDLKKYGAEAERKRLIARWSTEIGSLIKDAPAADAKPADAKTVPAAAPAEAPKK